MNTLLIHDLPTLVGLLAKTTLLLLAASAMSLFLRPASAATRHLVWTAALAGVLLLPLLSVCMPSVNIRYARPAAVSSRPPLAPPMAAQAPPPSGALDLGPVGGPLPSGAALREPAAPPLTAVTPPEAGAGHRAGRPVPMAKTVLGAGLCAWLLGSLAVLLHLTVGLRRVGRLRRRAVALGDAVVPIAEAARQQIGPRRPVRFLRAAEADAVAVPVTWGVLRPFVLLPAQFSAWSEDCLRAALLHELAHVQRWDWPTQLMGRVTCALYWWHPLVWWAARRAREEGERACDDLVLGTGMKAADYAQRLVEVVRSMPAGAPARTVAVAMAQPSEVEGRVRAVLAGGRDRRAPTRRLVLGMTLTLAIGLGPVAALRLTPSARAAGGAGGNVTVRSLNGGTEYVSPTSDKLVYPNGPIHQIGRHGATPAPVASGYGATLPNGYTVEVVGVAREVNKGGQWAFTQGPWWAPDGTLLPGPPVQQDLGWRRGPISVTGGVAPTYVATHVTPPAGLPITGDTSDPSWFGIEETLGGPTRRPSSWAYTFPSTNVETGSLDAVFKQGARACTYRVSIAAGPWHTAATLPFRLTPKGVRRAVISPANLSEDALVRLDDRPAMLYQDAAGHPHVDYFLGAGGVLGHVARRVVAVYGSGQAAVPQQTATGMFGTPLVALAFPGGPPTSMYSSNVDLTWVKELRLETRPYQTVEIRNVQLQPRQAVASRPIFDPRRTPMKRPAPHVAAAALIALAASATRIGAQPLSPASPPPSHQGLASPATTRPHHLGGTDAGQAQAEQRSLAVAQANLTATTANLAAAKEALSRSQRELRSGSISAEEYHRALLGVAQAEYRRASSELELTRKLSRLRDVPGHARNISSTSASARAVAASKGITFPPQVTPLAAGESITEAEEQLRRVTVGYQSGANTRADVSEATIALAEARVRSAVARDEFAGLGPDLEAVVTQRQQQLGEARSRFRVGAGGTGDVNQAEEALAEARVRADLYAVLTARRSSLSEVNVRYRSGAASVQEVDRAAAASQKAEHAFVAPFIESGGD